MHREEKACLRGSLTRKPMESPKIDTTHVAFLLLESLYASNDINLKTYQNVLKKKKLYEAKRLLEAE